MVNEWDPIGVVDLAPDEYDCLLPPLWSRVSRGASRSELSDFLWFELKDHFGLDPTDCDVDGVADRLHALGQAWQLEDQGETPTR